MSAFFSALAGGPRALKWACGIAALFLLTVGGCVVVNLISGVVPVIHATTASEGPTQNRLQTKAFPPEPD